MIIRIREPDVDYKTLISTAGEFRDCGALLDRLQWSSDAFKECNKRISELSGGPGVLADVMDHLDGRRETQEDYCHKQLGYCAEAFSTFLQYAAATDRMLAAQINVATYQFQETYEWAHPDFGKSFWQKMADAFEYSWENGGTEIKISVGVTVVGVLALATVATGGTAPAALVAALKGSVVLGLVGTSAGAIYGGVTEGAEGAYKYGAEGLFLGTTIGATTGASLAATAYAAEAGTGFWGTFWGSNLIGLGIRTGSGVAINVSDRALNMGSTGQEFDADYAKTLALSTGVSLALDAAGIGIFRYISETGISRAAPDLFYTADELKTLGIKAPTGTVSQEAFFGEIFTSRLNSGAVMTVNEVRYLQGATNFKVPMPQWFSNPLAGEGVNLNLLGFVRPSLGTIGGRAVTKDDLGFKDIPDIFFFESLMIDRSKSKKGRMTPAQ